MSSNGEGCAEPREFKNWSIRDYVAEVRKRDWKKCCPFNLFGNSEEFIRLAEKVYTSLFLQGNDALVTTPENTNALNCLHSSGENSKVQKARINNDDAVETIYDGPSESYDHTQIKKIINEVAMASVNVNVVNTANDGSASSDSNKEKDAEFQNETNVGKDAISYENVDLVIEKDAVMRLDEGASEPVLTKVNGSGNADDAKASELMKPQKFRSLRGLTKILNGAVDAESAASIVHCELKDHCEVTKGESEDEFIVDTFNKKKGVQATRSKGILRNKGKTPLTAKPIRNRGKRLKLGSSSISYCELSPSDESEDDSYESTDSYKKKDIQVTTRSKGALRNKGNTPLTAEPIRDRGKRLKLGGSSISYCELTSNESEDDSDENTSDTSIKKKKGVQALTRSKGALRNKRKTSLTAEPICGHGKRLKLGNNSERRSRSSLKINQTEEESLQMTNKRKNSYAKRMVYKKNGAPYSSGSEKNASGTRKNSLRSCRLKSNRKMFQEDCERDDLNLDGIQLCFTEENILSGPAHSVESAQVFQPTITISNKSAEKDFVIVEKIREYFPSNQSEALAAMQLLRLSSADVNMLTPFNTSTEDPTSVTRRNSSSQPPVEVDMVNDASLPRFVHTEPVNSICSMNRNPAEYGKEIAAKYVRDI